MKTFILFLATLLALSSAAAQGVTFVPEIPRHLDPQTVSINKELPRGPFTSLIASNVQPLTEWTRIETPEAVTYKNSFRVPFEWIDRRQILHLEQVSASFDVSVNGELAGYSQAGSLPAEFDVTEFSHEGANELAITVYREPIAQQKLENDRPAASPAIVGDVYILSQPLLRVRDIVVDTRTEGTSGLLELGVIMKSHRLNEQVYTVLYELLDSDAKVLAWERKEAKVDMRREDTVRFFANIRNIKPWSPDSPKTYTLRVETRQGGRVREDLAFEIGFRNDLSYGVTIQADIDTHLSGTSRKVGGNPSNDPVWLAAYLDRTLGAYHVSKRDPSVVAFSLAEDSSNGICLYESYLTLKALERRRPILYTDGGEWNTDL